MKFSWIIQWLLQHIPAYRERSVPLVWGSAAACQPLPWWCSAIGLPYCKNTRNKGESDETWKSFERENCFSARCSQGIKLLRRPLPRFSLKTRLVNNLNANWRGETEKYVFTTSPSRQKSGFRHFPNSHSSHQLDFTFFTFNLLLAAKLQQIWPLLLLFIG